MARWIVRRLSPGFAAYLASGLVLAGGLTLATMLAGCESADPRTGARQGSQANRQAAPNASQSPSQTLTPSRDTATTRSASAAKPMGYVNGQPIYLSEMSPMLMELAGGQILTEMVVDRLLKDRLARRREAGRPLPAVDDARIQQERRRLLDTLSDEPDEAARLLRELRQRRGLGELRFQALLHRNAILRMLVQEQVEVDPGLVEQAYLIRYGEKRQARVIVTTTADQAGQLRRRVLGGESFHALAMRHSIDASSEVGGMLPPISLIDPGYPQSLRNALRTLEPGQVSDVVALDQRYAVLKLEAKIEAEPVAFDSVREALAEEVRQRTEGMLMQRLARGLIAEADVLILDPSLAEAWQQQQRELLMPMP